ncbi:P-loop NTPase fold protein [Nonomuraea fuscirosea]|uniref:P-loop NTPase fold protein n=1 Tax=Nonomuraea fuscirosea TaxID=1291556 RepID=UPI00343E7D2D
MARRLGPLPRSSARVGLTAVIAAGLIAAGYPARAAPPMAVSVVPAGPLLVASVREAVASPEFLDEDRLSIALERLPTGTWPVVVVNPGPAADVEVRVAGPIADAIAFKGGNRARVPAGGAVTFTVIRGTRPHAGAGQLVLVSAAGVDRLRVAVTAQPSLLERYPFLPYAGGFLLLVIIVAAPLSWRRRRHAQPQPQPQETEEQVETTEAEFAEEGMSPSPSSRVPAASEGFTHSDEPVRDDELNRAAYVRQLAALAREATPPMVVGVFGEWGTGKTSMLLQLRRQLEQLDEQDPKCAYVWFDPWRHQHEDNPVLPLLHAIVNDLGLRNRENVRRTLRTISDVLGSLVLSGTLRVSLSDVRKSIEDYDDQHFHIRSERTRLDEYLGSLIDAALAAKGRERLVVFVDDLDRCDADRITGLLESLKLHFNRHNCVFVLGVAKGPLIAAVREKYGEEPVGDYLDKIIQFPFEMPRMAEADFELYLDRLLAGKEIAPASGMLKCALPRNPRSIKRFVNVLILQDRVAREVRDRVGDDGQRHVWDRHGGVTTGTSRGRYDVSILAAVLLLRDRAPETYARLTEEPSLLRRLAESAEEPADVTVAVIAGQLRGLGEQVPHDAGSYIDLVRDSPQPSDVLVAESQDDGGPVVTPWISRQEELPLRGPLDDLAGLVREQLNRRVGDDGALIDPVVRFGGEDAPRARGLDEILSARTGKLLLTGAAGTGKSVLAARLARRLSESRDGHVPVFLPFAQLKPEHMAHVPPPRAGQPTAYPAGHSPYERALAHALAAEYGLSLVNANAMLVRRRFVLVLDGLETLVPEIRDGFLEWAGRTEHDVILTGRAASVPGFEAVEVIGVVASEARGRVETLLSGRQVEPDRLLGLTSELLGSPALLAVLTGAPEWIDDLPREPVRFVPWYAERTLAATAAAGFDAVAVAEGLREIAAEMTRRRTETFPGDDPDVRATLRRAGVRPMDVSPLLQAAVGAGLLRQCEPHVFHFVHRQVREHLAGRR